MATQNAIGLLDLVKIRRTTTLALSGSYVDLTFDTTDIETDPNVIEHDNTNTDQIDIKQDGIYLLTWHCHADGNSGGFKNYSTQIRIDDTTVIDGTLTYAAAYGTGFGSSGINSVASGSTYVQLTNGEQITLQIRYEVAGITLNAGAVFTCQLIQRT